MVAQCAVEGCGATNPTNRVRGTASGVEGEIVVYVCDDHHKMLATGAIQGISIGFIQVDMTKQV